MLNWKLTAIINFIDYLLLLGIEALYLFTEIDKTILLIISVMPILYLFYSTVDLIIKTAKDRKNGKS